MIDTKTPDVIDKLCDAIFSASRKEPLSNTSKEVKAMEQSLTKTKKEPFKLVADGSEYTVGKVYLDKKGKAFIPDAGARIGVILYNKEVCGFIDLDKGYKYETSAVWFIKNGKYPVCPIPEKDMHVDWNIYLLNEISNMRMKTMTKKNI